MQETVELVPIQFEKVMRSRTYTCVVLASENKKFGIYTDPVSGKAMQLYLAHTEKTRPQTHDLLNRVFLGFEISLKQIVITDVQDTLYFARLFLEQKMGDILHIVEIDARPSDCITLALFHKVPLYCTREVLEKTIPYEE